MATKVVHFTVGGNSEKAEFRADDNVEDIKGGFCQCEVLCVVESSQLAVLSCCVYITYITCGCR